MSTLKIGGVSLTSRFFLGTAGYPSPTVLQQAIAASGTQVVTVGLKRQLAHGQPGTPATGPGDFYALIRASGARLLPNTAGCRTAREAVTLAHMARNAQGQQVALDALLDGSPAHALAGIARPEAFFEMLRARGARLTRTWALNDHQVFDSDFNSKLFNQIKRERLFLTEKDAVKLFPLLAPASADTTDHTPATVQGWAVPLVLEPEPSFFAAIDARLSSPHGPQTA